MMPAMSACLQCGRENPDDARFCNGCGAPLPEVPAAAREQRKTVTVLFCDLTGSTALGETLDPERLRALLAGYFERMRSIVERHGGTVEKFIGDAVMAVFGVPLVHEDDALRAVRAAVEMREAFPELGVRGRIGVTTGEVVTGTEERLATGDAVNVAARLEQVAQPGEILIGDETYRLTRDAVEVEEVEPLQLKGKAEPVEAHRLLSLRTEALALERRLETPMVGRSDELDLLMRAYKRSIRERACHLFTILGPAGVGKSRLAAEFLASLGDAVVVRGRCLPYGEGITYWPVVEIVKQLPEAELDEPAAQTIRGLTGDEQMVTSSEEIAWAFRKLLEAVAAARPLVCVFDDVHWGVETFLDLVEHVADLSRDAPILLLCIARPDLLDRRTGWGGGKVNATTALLGPLAPDETERLVESLAILDDTLRARISQAAEGNPLFVEEMVALVRESGDGEVTVPPTIQALLAARLDQLEPHEREVLQCGSVEGRVFHRGAVQALAPEEPQVMARLTALVRKELVRPDKPQLPGEDAFRFRHLLIRDAAYDALPKATRAELHERFAVWLEQHGADLVELDEILGYHLEQAWGYRRELGDARGGELADAARRRLTVAGRRALGRDDLPAALNLLERALALAPSDEIDIALEVDRLHVLFFSGQTRDAYLAAGLVAERAAVAGDRVAELSGRIEEGVFRVFVEPEGATEKLAALVDAALPVFEDAGDAFALYVAHRGLGMVAFSRARMDALLGAQQQALLHARRTGLPHLEARLWPWTAASRYFGSTPVSELLTWLDEQEAANVRDPYVRAFRAGGLSMLGRFEEARTIGSDLRAELADRGATITLALVTSQVCVELELLAGDPAAAVEFGEEGSRLLEESGERGWLSTSAGYLAQALYTLDRLDDADRRAGQAAELGASDDAITQMLWRQVRAKVLARRGEHADAERLAREAVAVGGEADMVNPLGDAHSDLAEVLELAGRREEAAAEVEKALALYERKGNLVMAERARARRAELRSSKDSAERT
jgi:class 3 adenylate cyclase/tetratricopeptide (TPR) repeat protein